mmetsp:Transcript_23342/g.47748  ORF Transcript_23342/g.47748 Transcript_23342/m.47748 type:complete len:183 (-) Transcript_23342:214-762(-)
MDQEQQFDDDVMLQIALQMSITEPAEVSAAPAESPEAVVSTEGTKEDSTAVPNEELPIDEALVLKDGSIVEETTAVLDKGGSSALPFLTTAGEIVLSVPNECVAVEAAVQPVAEPPKVVTVPETNKAADTSPKKKKKKKSGYASLMAGVMAPTLSADEKMRVAEERMKAGMGGGEFSKLDKI